MEVIYHSCNAKFFGHPRMGLLLSNGPDLPTQLDQSDDLRKMKVNWEGDCSEFQLDASVQRMTGVPCHANPQTIFLSVRYLADNKTYVFSLNDCRWWYLVLEGPATVTVQRTEGEMAVYGKTSNRCVTLPEVEVK